MSCLQPLTYFTHTDHQETTSKVKFVDTYQTAALFQQLDIHLVWQASPTAAQPVTFGTVRYSIMVTWAFSFLAVSDRMGEHRPASFRHNWAKNGGRICEDCVLRLEWMLTYIKRKPQNPHKYDDKKVPWSMEFLVIWTSFVEYVRHPSILHTFLDSFQHLSSFFISHSIGQSVQMFTLIMWSVDT